MEILGDMTREEKGRVWGSNEIIGRTQGWIQLMQELKRMGGGGYWRGVFEEGA